MSIIWNDAAVQAALIQAIGGVVAAALAAAAAALIGKRFMAQERLKQKNAALQNDLFFLLAVEEAHCERAGGGKLIVRELVRQQGFSWTGRFTPGRVSDLRSRAVSGGADACRPV